jgi:hypothetical protein
MNQITTKGVFMLPYDQFSENLSRNSLYRQAYEQLGPPVIIAHYHDQPSQNSSQSNDDEDTATASSASSPIASPVEYDDGQNPISEHLDSEDIDSELLDLFGRDMAQTNLGQSRNHYAACQTVTQLINKLSDLWCQASQSTTDEQQFNEEADFEPEELAAPGCCGCLSFLFKGGNQR